MSDTPEPPVERNRLGQFLPGRSGNMAGNRRGARTKRSLLLDALASDKAEEVLASVVAKARAGDMFAADIILRRVWPPRRARVKFGLPEINEPQDLVVALGAVARSVSEGILSPDEGQAIGQLLGLQTQAIELQAFKLRMDELERKINAGGHATIDAERIREA